MIGVELVAHLPILPARQVAMDSIEECRVHFLGHGVEKVGSPADCLNITVEVSDEDNRTLGVDELASSTETPIFHVVLHDVYAGSVRETNSSSLVERHCIPQSNTPSLTRCEIHEHLSDGGLSARN